MKLENQVCAREQAKRLKELGVEAESYFVWCESDSQSIMHEGWFLRTRTEYSQTPWLHNATNAYSCAELGVMLPCLYGDDDWGKDFHLAMHKINNIFQFQYECHSTFHSDYANKHEAQAKADLLIYLLEEKIIKPEDVKL